MNEEIVFNSAHSGEEIDAGIEMALRFGVSDGALTFDNQPIEGKPGTDDSFSFSQGTPAAVWTIPHNFNHRYVSVQIVENTGETCEADIEYTNDNVVTLKFSLPMVGTAIVRR